MAPRLRAEIARDGIDEDRLTARESLGQYSFLMGPKNVRRGQGRSVA